MYIDSTYLLLVLPAMLIAAWAQWNVKSSFNKYSRVYASSGYTAERVARHILDANGLYAVRIERVAGSLSDHFDPKTNVVRLSDTVYGSSSVASIGVAAHECGHAVQHAQGYFPMKVRAAIIPITQIGSNLAMPLVLLGLFFSIAFLVDLGILLFVSVVAFQLVTLPVEFNASRRAMQTLENTYILREGEETKAARKVLRAAALTYVAALIVALANLLRLLAISGRRRD